MRKNKIYNDMDFRQACIQYGLDWGKCDVYSVSEDEYVILVKVPNKNIYVLFDKNYKTICVEKNDWFKDEEAVSRFVLEKYDAYANKLSELPFTGSYFFPLDVYTLKQIHDLASRVFIYETNHGHSSDMFVNGELVIGDKDVDYVRILSYIRFISAKLDAYFVQSFRMKMIGFDYPDARTYLEAVISEVEECIFETARVGRRPFPVDVMENLGYNNRSVEPLNGELFAIIDLLLEKNGFKIRGGIEHYNEAEVAPKSEKDYTKLAQDLLRILDVPSEEVKRRREDFSKRVVYKEIDLAAWLNEKVSKLEK